MKIIILRSVGRARPIVDPYAILMNTAYSERVLGNLSGREDFCRACGERCIQCRKRYNVDLSRHIVRTYDFLASLPVVLDQPEIYLPEEVVPHDILIAVSVHEEILAAFIERFPLSRGVIVPVEESFWLTPYGKKHITEICEERAIEVSFPKPFCSFDPPAGILRDFRAFFRIGKPEVRFEVEKNRITATEVICSAPCGATYFVAKNLVGRELEGELVYAADSLLSSYPCTAGREVDREFNDSIMHRAVQIQRDILKGLDGVLRKPALTFRASSSDR